MNPDKPIQQAGKNLVISSVILCAAGLVLMIFSDTAVKMLGWIMGAVFAIIGIVKLVSYIRSKNTVLDLIFSILSLVLGVLFFIHPGWLMSLMSIIIGIYVLIEGAFKIKTAVDVRKQKNAGWWVLLVFAILSIAIGILLIFNPFGFGKLFMFIVGVALLISGVQNIIHAVYTKKILNEMNQDIIDMDDYVSKNL